METIQIASDLKTSGGSHEGMSGKHNEDSFGIFAWQPDGKGKFILGVVADGVGGQTAGEVASRLAVQTIEDYYRKQPTIDDVNQVLEQSIVSANQAVYYASQENPEYRGMSTTIAMVAIMDNRLYTAHVGDSRIYMMRDGILKQISTDHTWAQEAIEAGLLTRDQAKTHPNRNVIRRHLGGQLQVEVDHRLVLKIGQPSEESLANQGFPIKAGDTFLICSDGLTDMITDQSVYESLCAHYNDLETAVKEMIDKANQAGGKDNITVVLLQVPGGKAPVPVVPAVKPAAAASKAAAAPATANAAAPVVAAPAAPPAKKRSAGLFIVLGLFVLIVIGAGGVGLFLVFANNGDSQPTVEPTSIPVVDPETQESATSGAPATAAVLPTTAEQLPATVVTTGTPEESSPELIPTLRPTFTPTATRKPPTPTPTPTSTPTDTPVPPPSGGSGGGPKATKAPTPEPPPP